MQKKLKWLSIKLIRLFHFDLHSEHKSYSLILLPTPPVGEWNMKGCKTNTHTHTHTHTHTQRLIFYYNLFLLTMLVSFKCQMSKESLIILKNVWFHASAKLKQYEQLPENYNSSFSLFCGFAA